MNIMDQPVTHDEQMAAYYKRLNGTPAVTPKPIATPKPTNYNTGFWGSVVEPLFAWGCFIGSIWVLVHIIEFVL